MKHGNDITEESFWVRCPEEVTFDLFYGKGVRVTTVSCRHLHSEIVFEVLNPHNLLTLSSLTDGLFSFPIVEPDKLISKKINRPNPGPH